MSEAAFERGAIRRFRFVGAGLDAATGEVRLSYAFDAGPALVERLQIPGAPFAPALAESAAVRGALRLLHLIAGISYYKAAVPGDIRIESYTIDAQTARFLESLYENGLGEFAYRNGLSLRGKIRFPVGELPPSPPSPAGAGRREVEETPASRKHGVEPVDNSTFAPLPPPAGDGVDGGALRSQRALVAIGGGKDSLVSIELLRSAGVQQTVAWIGGAPLIRACAERTGLPTLNITRQLAPQLFEYNRQGAWNGHIPVTAINSAILVLAALLTGHEQVVFSNERSASYGSQITLPDGSGTGEVNHQWSKGWEFERGFAAQVRQFAPGLSYFSLLRPLSELAVARQFARLDRYDAHFSSCNRNFHLLGERPSARWCGVCPKCHFVFLALAPFMPKPRLMGIFGRNLLDEAALASDYDALLEFGEHKPFECVGEGRESRAAFHALSRSPSWREDALVARFAAEIEPRLPAADLALAPLLAPSGEHGIPSALWERIVATVRA
jgi:UDP-N-acetyl-alpha-D-muramoyl-L-alanyl-L-glutamate epimerase